MPSSSRRHELLRRLGDVGRHRWFRRGTALWVLPLAGLALGLLGVLAVTRLAAARGDLSLARSALQEARSAMAAHRVETALAALDRSDARLTAARRPAQSLPLSLLRPIPLAGSPVKALTAGVRAGREAVAAGRILAEAADAFPTSGTAAVDGHDLSAFHRAVEASTHAVGRADAHLLAARRALAGPAGAILPPVSAPARALLADLDRAEGQLASAERGLGLVAQLTAPGTDARLLLLSQDTMELRPTGGFIGSFGVLRISGGTVALERYENIADLPPPQPPLEAPDGLAAALPHAWDVSGSNWWPDFPTSARAAAELFRRQGGGEVDGVVAVTELVMARLVGIFGPIEVPGYAEPVGEDGFAQRILYEVELKRPEDVPRKKFLTLLAGEVLGRLFSLPGGQVPAVVDALGGAADAGDLQVWFARPEWQAAVAATSLAGSLPPPEGDFLLLVEANLTGSKANANLVRDVAYRVRPSRDGRLRATLRIEYRNQGPETPVNPYYNGSVRLYVPRGSVRLEAGDPAGPGEAAADGPYDVFSRSVFVPPQGQAVLTFDYFLPDEVVGDGRYRLTWLRQAGTRADTLRATVGYRTFQADPAKRRLEVSAPAPGQGRSLLDLLPGR